MMPFIARLYVILIMATLVAGCGVRDARYSPKTVSISTPVLPPDVVGPSNGIFSLSPSADPAEMCCWIAPSALLHVKKTLARARVLTVGFYLPKTAQAGGPSERLRLTFVKSGFTVTIKAAGEGFHVKHVRLPAHVGGDGIGKSEIRLTSSNAFYPGGKNGPRYSVMLTSIYFE